LRDRDTIGALMSGEIDHAHAISLAQINRNSLAG
jgi:hypothetical protein